MMLSIKHMMQPYDATSLKLGVVSVRASPTDAADTKVVWSYSYNGMQVPADCSAYSLPANIVGKGGSVIVVDATYVFKPLFGDFVPGISGAMTWTNKSYHSPRNSCVDYVEGDNCTQKLLSAFRGDAGVAGRASRAKTPSIADEFGPATNLIQLARARARHIVANSQSSND